MVTVFPEPADLLLFFNFLLAMNVSLDTLHNSCSEWNKLPSEKTPVLFFFFYMHCQVVPFCDYFFEKGEKKKKDLVGSWSEGSCVLQMLSLF